MTEQAAPKPEERKLFHEKATDEAGNFVAYLLSTIPELESVAVVFNFAVNAPDLPVAVVRGLSGQLKSPVEITHMCAQLARVWQSQMALGHQCVQTLDQYMAEQAKKLMSLQTQIKELEGKLNGQQPSEGGQ